MMVQITIIVATFGRAQMLENALESVRYIRAAGATELIVIDGDSDPAVTAIARRHDARLISEPDQGLYDAWNKGLAAANGEVIGFLNDDDLYLPAVTEALQAFLMSKANAFSGAAARGIAGLDMCAELVMPHEVGRHTVVGVPNAINARFFRRGLVETVPRFDASLRIWADKAWLARMSFESPITMIHAEPVYFYGVHPGSLTLGRPANRVALPKERIKAITCLQQEYGITAKQRRDLQFWSDIAYVDYLRTNALASVSVRKHPPQSGFLLWALRVMFWAILWGVPFILYRRRIVLRGRRALRAFAAFDR